MGFHAKKDDLRNVKYITRNQIGTWEGKLRNAEAIMQKIQDLDSFTGQAAESVKCYLQEVHGLLLAGIRNTMQNYAAVITLYVDGYEEIDGHLHAILKEDILEGARSDYQNSRSCLDDAHRQLQNTINSIMDLIYLYMPSRQALSDNYSETDERIRDLVSAVRDHESQTCASDIAQLRNVIQSVRRYIREQTSKASDYPVNYHSGDFQYDTNIYDLAIAIQQTSDYVDINRESLERAIENEERVQESLEAEAAEERAGQGMIKLVVGTVTVISCVAIIVGTCGTGTPAALSVSAGVFGGMGTMYGISEMTEGAQEAYYGFRGDITSVSINPIRDTVFQGNEEAYQAWGMISTTAASLCVPINAGLQAAKITGGKAFIAAGKEVLKDQLVDAAGDFVGDTAAEYVVDMADENGDMKEYQKEIIRRGTSKIVSQGITSTADFFSSKTFRDDMSRDEQRRYDAYWSEKARQRDSGGDYHPNDLSDAEIQRMRYGQRQLEEGMQIDKARLVQEQFDEWCEADRTSVPASLEMRQKRIGNFDDTDGGAGSASSVNSGYGFRSDTYTAVEYNGSVEVNHVERDVSRRVYQRNDIDLDRVDDRGRTNYQRMLDGDSPIGSDGKPIELHHVLQEEPGTMVEIEGSTHDQYKKQLHGLFPEREGFRNEDDLKKQYNNFRSQYWKNRAAQLMRER